MPVHRAHLHRYRSAEFFMITALVRARNAAWVRLRLIRSLSPGTHDKNTFQKLLLLLSVLFGFLNGACF